MAAGSLSAPNSHSNPTQGRHLARGQHGLPREVMGTQRWKAEVALTTQEKGQRFWLCPEVGGQPLEDSSSRHLE